MTNTKKEGGLATKAKALVAALGTVVAFVIAVAGDDNIQFDGGEQGMVATFVLTTLGVFLARNKGKDLNTNGSEAKADEVTQGGSTSAGFPVTVTEPAHPVEHSVPEPVHHEPVVVEPSPYYEEPVVAEPVHADPTRPAVLPIPEDQPDFNKPYGDPQKDRDC